MRMSIYNPRFARRPVGAPTLIPPRRRMGFVTPGGVTGDFNIFNNPGSVVPIVSPLNPAPIISVPNPVLSTTVPIGVYPITPPAPSPIFVPGSSTTPTVAQSTLGPVAQALDPTTGQVVTSIPPLGPLPPGAGFQQVQTPGSPYPYVYIGGGAQPTPGSVYVPPAAVDDPVYPGWKNQNPPGGSYQQSCRQITADGQNLWALCNSGGGVYVPTSLNYSQCDRGAPYNQNGQLSCGGPGGAVSAPASALSPISPALPPSYFPIGGSPGSYAGQVVPVSSGGVSITTQISNFFSKYGLYVAGGLAAYLLFFRKGGRSL